ncbi:MAG: hypothetical protein P0116_14745 [Candidatus Nitrosocosmicus sp.]|nr:hypothetical protein [Candidatus Nitrosocosmicus sp.]
MVFGKHSLAITMLMISIIYFTSQVRKRQIDEMLIKKIIVAEKEKLGKITESKKLN